MSEKSRRKRLMRLRGEKRTEKRKLKGLSVYVTPRFRPPELFANYYAGRDPKPEEVVDGTETDRVEAEPPRSEDPGTGVELEEGEVQSRAGDNASLDEEGTAQGEPAGDQS